MHQTLLLFIELLLVASVIAALVHRIRIPYSTALVLGGWILSGYHVLPDFHLEPEVVLLIMLPVLLFESAITTNASLLKEQALSVFSMALPGVLISMLVIGTVIHFVLHLDWSVALLFGAIMAPTDTVSIMSVFKHLKLPDRLRTLVEGESLFNDGTAIVAFNALVITSQSPWHTAGNLFFVVIGGLVVGGLTGGLVAFSMRQSKDHLVEIMLTSVLTYGAYLMAERLGVSGVIAVVTAGLVVGTFGISATTSPTSLIALGSFWEYAGFVVNSLLFLLIGLQLDLNVLLTALPSIAVAILAVLLGRILGVYPLCSIFKRTRIPFKWQHVLVLGNLKGSISMALALSLPIDFPHRSLILAMAYGVVLFSLVIQGLSLGPAVQALHLTQSIGSQEEYEKNQGALLAARAVQDELGKMFSQGIISRSIYNQLNARYQGFVAKANRELRMLQERDPKLADKELQDLSRQMQNLERSIIRNALRDRIIGEEAAKAILEKLDARFEIAAEPLKPNVSRHTRPL